MPTPPSDSTKPGDEYDPRTDEHVDRLLRELHADFYEEIGELEKLKSKQSEIDEKLEGLKKAKEHIEHHEPYSG